MTEQMKQALMDKAERIAEQGGDTILATMFLNGADYYNNRVWHDVSEKPADKSKVMVWTGDELVQCHFMFDKYTEKTPTEEHGEDVLVGNPAEGYGTKFVGTRSRADMTESVVMWAYLEDLLPDGKEVKQ